MYMNLNFRFRDAPSTISTITAASAIQCNESFAFILQRDKIGMHSDNTHLSDRSLSLARSHSLWNLSGCHTRSGRAFYPIVCVLHIVCCFVFGRALYNIPDRICGMDVMRLEERQRKAERDTHPGIVVLCIHNQCFFRCFVCLYYVKVFRFSRVHVEISYQAIHSY